MIKPTPRAETEKLSDVKRRAKALLRDLEAGDADALRRVRASHPSFRSGIPTDFAGFGLHHAQLVIARESGFPSWPRLKWWFEWKDGRQARFTPFRADPDYFRDRAFGLKSMLEAGDGRAREQVRLFHPRFRASGDADEAWASFSDADAELVVAGQHGFDTWEAFEVHLAHLRVAPDAQGAQFRHAFEAIEAGDPAAVDALVAAHPEIVNLAGTNGNTLLGLAGAALVTPDLNRRPGERNTALAARFAIARSLIAAGAEVDAANTKGWTALHQAAYANNVDFARLLVEAGATIDLEAYGEGGTPLTVALWWGHREVSEYLAGLGVAPRNLRVAAGLGDLDALGRFFDSHGRLTREAGAQRGFHRPHSGFPHWTPTPGDEQEIIDDAFSFAVRGGRIGAMEFLHERGAGLDAVPCNGSPLQWAASQGRMEAVRWLVAKGADVNAKAPFARDFGHTALHRAAFADDPDVIRPLVEAGGDLSIADDKYGSTPLGWASFLGKRAAEACIVQSYGDRCNVDDLCLAGAGADAVAARLDADPAAVHGPSGTGAPLRAAALCGRADLVRLLLARGADPLATSTDGRCARDLAAERGHGDVVALLDAGEA